MDDRQTIESLEYTKVVIRSLPDYHFDIFKPFYCLSVVDWRLLITTLVYSSLSIVCLSSIEGFWLPLWYIQAFLLSVCRRLKASTDNRKAWIYQSGNQKPSMDDRRTIERLEYTKVVIRTSLSIVCLSSKKGFWLPLWYIQAFLLSVSRRLKASDYHFGIFKPIERLEYTKVVIRSLHWTTDRQ
jgi:ubiquitin-protein ligase